MIAALKEYFSIRFWVACYTFEECRAAVRRIVRRRDDFFL